MAAEPKRTACNGYFLPPEIWTEILSRVPVKSILLCRSVCKSWYSLVSCPRFISDYTTRNLNKNGNRLLLQLFDSRGIVKSFPFSSYDVSFKESHEHDDVPEAFLGCDVEIVGSCNGLICLSISDDRSEVITFLIWNPTIRKVIELRSRSCSHCDGQYSCYGFGFDSKTGDYKVMCVHSVYSGRRNRDSSDADGNVCEIYDLRKGVWRGISPLMHSLDVWGGTPECYLDGSVHWTRFRSIRPGSRGRILLSFDMSDEIFREISMPDCAEFVWNDDDDYYGEYSYIETRSVTLNGLIHVIVWKVVQYNNGNDDTYEECSVWAMKEYGVAESWTRLFDIDLPSAEVYQCGQPCMFRLWENGEVLMLRYLPEDESNCDNEDSDDDDDDEEEEEEDLGDREELSLYNPESKKCKQLFSFTQCISDMCFYEESLVLM